VRGPARERGGDWLCGQEFSAGLIFLCFVSFYQEKEMKRLKEHLPNKDKSPPLYYISPISSNYFGLMNGLKNIFKFLKSRTLTGS
jgi:hypothetical protein